jgi:hypothetical protein
MRAARTPIDPIPMEVGDKVTFREEKRPYTVRAKSERYVILTKPFNLQHTVLYCVIDWESGVRGPDDYYGLGYETQEDIDHALALFEGQVPDTMIHPEVSHRHGIRCNITHLNGVAL